MKTVKVVAAVLLHVPLLLLAGLGGAMVDWAGSEPRDILMVAVAVSLIAGALWFLSRRIALIVIPAAVAFALIATTFVDVSPVQPAARAVREIHAGMTEAEVRQILNAEFPERLRPPRMSAPMSNNLISFAVGSGSSYDAAFVHVEFDRGRVVRANFLAD